MQHLRTMGICASTSNVEPPSEQNNPIGSSSASTKSNRALEKKVSEILTKAKKRREVIQDAAANISPDYKAPSFAKPENVKTMLKKVLSGQHKNPKSGMMEDNFFLFNSLSEELRENFVMAMEKEKLHFWTTRNELHL